MSHLARGPASAGIDSKANASGGRQHGTQYATDGMEAAA
jgi:hypothetical protein